MTSTNDRTATADIGLTGLAVMGRNLARNIARHGHTIAVHNRTTSRMTSLVEEHADEGTFVGSETLEEFVASIARPRAVIVMVKAGAGTDAVIDELVPLLDEGDIVVDAGNAHFQDTRRREKALAEKGLHFVGMGVSGGEEGALNGPSIMVGGSEEAYATLGPVLESIAAQVDGTPCCTHVGPDGAGHFVKMVHNGIEYADMQLIAESYDLLRSVLGVSPAEIAEIFRDWNEGDLESFLIEITADVLAHEDAADRPAVRRRGRRRRGAEGHRPVDGAERARPRRPGHRHRRGDLRPQPVRPRRAAGRRPQARSGPARRATTSPDREQFVDDVRAALYASKVVAYAQGFDQMRAGSDEYGWGVDLGSMATIWRGGCIIRARFLDRIAEAYDGQGDLTTLLVAPYFVEAVSNGVDAWRRVVAAAAQAGVPTPAFSSSLAYFDALRRDRLPAALIQGLRDNFGAHTYQRVDRDGTFHTSWAADRTESPA